MSILNFEDAFDVLTGNRPLSWQCRLYHEWFSQGKLPAVIDLPTGLGKTMVMAIWGIARANKLGVPTRLVYVVDRRTVVDQATDLAKKLVANWKQKNIFEGQSAPVISTLRGHLADNREWSRDLSQPAIIIGTVDLIGSGLLFSGYRSSFKRRPLEAGMLGCDSLLVLDEAHLSKPFEKLLRAIESFQASCDADIAHAKPIRVVRMSATAPGAGSNENGAVFRLEGDFEGQTGDFADEPARKRYSAEKHLRIAALGAKVRLADRLAAEAIAIEKDNSRSGKRIVVFVRKPSDATEVAKAIREHVDESVDRSGPKPKKVKENPYAGAVEVLTGTMRGLERDELVEKEVFKKRWLDGDLHPDDEGNQAPVFLVCTSAGEVGFDLNADHMVCDATTIDSLIQRLGRVNRRGLGSATVVLVREPAKLTDGKPTALKGLELAVTNTLELLSGVDDVSPKNIASLKENAWKENYAAACSPDVATVELTDILLDAWSMTSITERMPGRPEVGPWLRGIDDQQSQTTVAWRAELQLVGSSPQPEKALEAILVKHPIRPHESLTVNTSYVIEFLKQISKAKQSRSALMATRVAVRLPRGQVVCRTIGELAEEPRILYADSTLVLPANLGGLNHFGMLDAESVRDAVDADSSSASLDRADWPDYEQTDAVRSRLRVVINRSDSGSWSVEQLSGGAPIPSDLPRESKNTTALFNGLRAANFRIRLVQPIHFDEEDEADRLLVSLGPAPKKRDHEDQPLAEHVGAVETEAMRIAKELGLAADKPVRIALLFAARWHDEGKKAEIWQWFAYRKEGEDHKGKSSKTRDPKSLCGYRHELGSLLRIYHVDRCDTTGCVLPADGDARDLALHLIATHHGASRPHFGQAIYDPFTDKERDEVHIDAMRRFSRLQRKYGWWQLTWLENLLRCADAIASADQEASDEPADLEGAAR